MSRRWDEAGGVVTPEAVPLQFPEAGVGSRAISFFIDLATIGLVLTMLNATIGYLYDGNGLAPGWVAITALVLVNFVVFFGYPIAFETFWHGRTPGKAAMGLRVVTVEGAPVQFRHAAIRAALGLVDFGLTSGVAAMLASLLSKRHQRLGDMVGGTVVLRERSVAPPPRATTFPIPPGAEAYAATIDPSGLSTSDYEAVREFLLRCYTLRPEARAALGHKLATAVAAKLAHTPPSMVSAELFLTCLAARYQQRGAGPEQQQPLDYGPPPAYEPAPAQAVPYQSALTDVPPAPTSQPPPSGDDFAPPR